MVMINDDFDDVDNKNSYNYNSRKDSEWILWHVANNIKVEVPVCSLVGL